MQRALKGVIHSSPRAIQSLRTNRDSAFPSALQGSRGSESHSKEGQRDSVGSTWTLKLDLHGIQSPELPLLHSVALFNLSVS